MRRPAATRAGARSGPGPARRRTRPQLRAGWSAWRPAWRALRATPTGSPQAPRPTIHRSSVLSPPMAVRCVSRRRSSFFVLLGLWGTYAVPFTGPAIYSRWGTRPSGSLAGTFRWRVAVQPTESSRCNRSDSPSAGTGQLTGRRSPTSPDRSPRAVSHRSHLAFVEPDPDSVTGVRR